MKFVVIDLITPTIYMHKIKSMHSYSNLQNVRHSVFHHTMSITCTLSLLVFASMNMVAFLSDGGISNDRSTYVDRREKLHNDINNCAQ